MCDASKEVFVIVLVQVLLEADAKMGLGMCEAY